MAREPVAAPAGRMDRNPPYSEEAEQSVLGSMLLDPEKVIDLSLERQLIPESFYVPAHRVLFEAIVSMSKEGRPVDVLTLAERLRTAGQLDRVGGTVSLDRLVDATPTAAHAEYYIDIVRQKHLLRSILSCSREAENSCFGSDDSADLILSRIEQAFMDITERQHGSMTLWADVVSRTMEHVETVLTTRRGLSGLPTGLANLDKTTQGLRAGEMVVLAARPSMGKTSLAMNVAENIALGKVSDHEVRPVGIFSLEMSSDSLVLRMLCSHAEVSAFKLSGGYIAKDAHQKLTQAASVLRKAPIYLDDTGGLDIMELRARARRMKKKYGIQLLVIDYLQLLHSREYSRQGRQMETADISGNIKAMAKELRIPVLVLSQLNRSPEKSEGRPKLSDLRDSGAIEQDADVVCFLRRPCRIEDDPEHEDQTLAIVDVAKQRNGPTGEVKLNFEEEFTRFKDRSHGVDGIDEMERFAEQGPAAQGVALE